MTIEAASNTAIEAMQLGAFDYLAKPLSVDPLRDLVDKAIEQRKMTSVPVGLSVDEEKSEDSSDLFIGRSDAMLKVFKDIGRVSKQDVPILVRGESGTGKELVARALFQYSNRYDGNASTGSTQSPGAGLPALVQRLLTEKSTNIYAEAMEYVERYVLVEILKATDGNQSQAAEMLGITRGKLRDRINSYGIVLESGVSLQSDK